MKKVSRGRADIAEIRDFSEFDQVQINSNDIQDLSLANYNYSNCDLATEITMP